MFAEITLKRVEVDELTLSMHELAYAISGLTTEEQVEFIRDLDDEISNWDFTVKAFLALKKEIAENLDEILEDGIVTKEELLWENE